MKQINGFKRLTKKQLDDFYSNSGITELQYKIIKYRYFDCNNPTVISQCLELGNCKTLKYYMYVAMGE